MFFTCASIARSYDSNATPCTASSSCERVKTRPGSPAGAASGGRPGGGGRDIAARRGGGGPGGRLEGGGGGPAPAPPRRDAQARHIERDVAGADDPGRLRRA